MFGFGPVRATGRSKGEMMRGGPLRLVATAGAAVVAGVFTLSMVSSVSLRAFQFVVENKRVLTFSLAAHLHLVSF